MVKNMNIFLCKTPMQVLRALQLTYYDKNFKSSDLCVFNTFDTSYDIYERIKNMSIFKSVHYFKNNDFRHGKLNYLRSYTSNNKLNMLFKDSNYNSITIFNSDTFDSFSAFNHAKNIEVWYVEDTPMLYSYEIPQKKNKILYGLIGLKFPILEVSRWYFSVPEKMKKTNNAAVYKLQPLRRSDKKFVQTVNEIFDYTPDDIIHNTDIFIMEECFFTDDIIKDNSDYLLYKKIRDAYPMLNFSVKLHPRTKINRFESEFAVIKKSNIPWEVYLLNENMNNKIFLSLSCSTVLSPKLLFNDEYRCMMLYRLIKDKAIKSNGQPYYNDEWEKQLNQISNLYINKDKVRIPNNENEALKFINEMTCF